MSTETGIAKAIRELSRSPDDAILIKYGVMTEEGKLTSSGIRIMRDLFLQENKSKIVALVKQAARKAKKDVDLGEDEGEDEETTN